MPPDDQHEITPPSRAPALVRARAKPPATVGELLREEDATTHRLSAVAGRFLSAERAMRLAVTAVNKTPLLARCTPVSFMGALMAATGLGLEPNTPRQHAFLIPYKNRQPRRDQNGTIMKDERGSWIYDDWYECQFQIGYRGFVTLFYRSPIITEVTAEAVYEGDRFEHQKGTETYLRYEKAINRSRGELVASWCFTRLDRGQAFTVLPLSEIEKARSRSQTFRSLGDRLDEAKRAVEEKQTDRNIRALARAQSTFDEQPWVLWEEQMAAKTAIRRHASQQDLGEQASDIAVASDLDALGDSGAIDISDLADPDRAAAVMKGEQDLDRKDEPQPEEGDEEKPAAAEQPKEPQAEPASRRRRSAAAPPAQAAAEPAREAVPDDAASPAGEAADEREPEPAQTAAEPEQPTRHPPAQAAQPSRAARDDSDLFE